MKVYIIWLIGIILWNFGYPNAIPIADVIAAILLSFLSNGLKKYIKRTNLPQMVLRLIY